MESKQKINNDLLIFRSRVFFLPKSIGGRSTPAESLIYKPHIVLGCPLDIFELYNKSLNRFIYDENIEGYVKTKIIQSEFIFEFQQAEIGSFVDAEIKCFNYSFINKMLAENNKFLIREGRFITAFGVFESYI